MNVERRSGSRPERSLNGWPGSRNAGTRHESHRRHTNNHTPNTEAGGKMPPHRHERQPIKLRYGDLSRSDDRNYTGHGGKGSRKSHVLGDSMTLRIPGAKTLERHRGHSRLRTRPRHVSSSSRSGY